MGRASPFASETVSWASPAGRVELGVVDVDAPGIAEGISRLLVGSIHDASSERGGHLPARLVHEIEASYLTPERVRTLWASAGHRFVARIDERVVGTVHVAARHDVVLTADRTRNNVPAADLPGLKPDRHHQVVNVSVAHVVRRHGIAARMFDAVTTSFRHLFDGDGLWVRADPPWHGWLRRLGFLHDPSFDVFLPSSVAQTAMLPHAAFNLLYACACEGARAPERSRAMASGKLQYVSFTRAFTQPPAPGGIVERSPVAPSSSREIEAELAVATQRGYRIAIGGAGYGPALTPAERTLTTLGLNRVVSVADDHVVVEAGVTWRALLGVLPPDVVPPVVPGWIDATIGGSLSTGGIGKGSARRGLAIDHVRELVVVTRDGRKVRCSHEREPLIFAAALGGFGTFGAIVEATLPLERRSPWLAIERTLVGPSDLASALDVDAYHAFAVRTDRGFVAITAKPSDDATQRSLASFLAPPAREVGAEERSQVQAFFDATSLASLIDALQRDGALDTVASPNGALTIHPIRRAGARASLLFPDFPVPSIHAVTVSAPREAAELRRRFAAHGGRLAPRWKTGGESLSLSEARARS